MRYPPFSALANVLVRSQKQEDALAMSTELGRLLDPAPEGVKVLGPAEAPVPKLKSEFRYQLLLKAVDRKRLNETLRELQRFAHEQKWTDRAGDRCRSADVVVACKAPSHDRSRQSYRGLFPRLV